MTEEEYKDIIAAGTLSKMHPDDRLDPGGVEYKPRTFVDIGQAQLRNLYWPRPDTLLAYSGAMQRDEIASVVPDADWEGWRNQIREFVPTWILLHSYPRYDFVQASNIPVAERKQFLFEGESLDTPARARQAKGAGHYEPYIPRYGWRPGRVPVGADPFRLTATGIEPAPLDGEWRQGLMKQMGVRLGATFDAERLRTASRRAAKTSRREAATASSARSTTWRCLCPSLPTRRAPT